MDAEIVTIELVNFSPITGGLILVSESADDENRLATGSWICEIRGRVEVCGWEDVDGISASSVSTWGPQVSFVKGLMSDDTYP